MDIAFVIKSLKRFPKTKLQNVVREEKQDRDISTFSFLCLPKSTFSIYATFIHIARKGKEGDGGATEIG